MEPAIESYGILIIGKGTAGLDEAIVLKKSRRAPTERAKERYGILIDGRGTAGHDEAIVLENFRRAPTEMAVEHFGGFNCIRTGTAVLSPCPHFCIREYNPPHTYPRLPVLVRVPESSPICVYP
jgi:hypothetical protein